MPRIKKLRIPQDLQEEMLTQTAKLLPFHTFNGFTVGNYYTNLADVPVFGVNTGDIEGKLVCFVNNCKWGKGKEVYGVIDRTGQQDVRNGYYGQYWVAFCGFLEEPICQE